MKNKEKQIDTSNYWTDIDVVYVKRRLTRGFIKLKAANILALCFNITLSTGLSAITYFTYEAERISILTILLLLVVLFFWIGIVFLIKDCLCKIKKISRNEFVLAEAKMQHLFEDISTAEGPYLIGDSYATYFCKACNPKQIKIKKYGTSAEYFSENTKVFAAFLCKSGNIEEKPFMMFIGKEYVIEEDIMVI